MPAHDMRERDKQENGMREHDTKERGMTGHDMRVHDSLRHKTPSFPLL